MTEPTTNESTEDEPVSGSPQPLVEDPPETTVPKPIAGAQTSTYADLNPEDPLYVPVTNANYIPAGAPLDDKGFPKLEGFVPATPGNDSTLNRIKQALEAQGHESGPAEPEEPPVEPEEPPVDPPETQTEPEEQTL